MIKDGIEFEKAWFMHKRAQEQIDRAPQSPGVYVLKGKEQKALYVGKAVRLRDRLKSYLRPDQDTRPSIAVLAPQVKEVEWLLTDNEKEALILENNLIKSYRPKYNIDLRDDKSYVSLRLTSHGFPRLFVTRKIVKDGSHYFGPYSSAANLRQTLKFLQKIFQIRDCTDSYFNNRSRPCLRYQIKRCSAPCVDYVTREEYAEQVRQVEMFLSGDEAQLVKRLKNEMKQASTAQRYEEAAVLRDRLMAVEGTLEPQKVESRKDNRNADAIGLAGDQDATLIKVLKLRKGKLVGADEFFVQEPVSASEEILRAFLQQYYLRDFLGHEIPRELLVSVSISDAKSFEALLTERRGRKVQLFSPQKGPVYKLLKLSERNAQSSLAERKRKSEKTHKLLIEVQRKFKLDRLPHRMEGYDISSFHGAEPYGSMVVFVDGEADKTKYRYYKIRNVKGSNDFAMLREMFERRFQKLDDANYPDLILVDGGKGQLRQALDVFHELGIHDIPLISIAKEKELRSRSGKKFAPERFFLPGQKNAIVLPSSSPILHFMQRVRDEAHRFGITRHRKARKRATLRTVLERIPGIGSKRQKILLRTFKDIPSIQNASLETLCVVKGLNRVCAHSVYEFFRSYQELS